MLNFIINPHSRSHMGINIWKDLKAILEDKQVEYKEFMTAKRDSAKRITEKIIEKSSQNEIMIIVLGGDGTLNEVINGITDVSRVTLGYIPIGSSNDFARGMNLPTNPLSALKMILHPTEYSYIDYGTVTVGDTSRRYIVSSGLGFDARVCYETNYSHIKKALNKVHMGKMTYLAITLRSMISQPYAKVTYTFDDGTSYTYDRVLLSVTHIQRYEGGGIMFCPDADPYDHMLDVCIAEGIEKNKAVFVLKKAYQGDHVLCKGIHTLRCKSIHIKSNIPMHIHTDGETLFVPNSDNNDEPVFLHDEATYSCSSDGIRIITG